MSGQPRYRTEQALCARQRCAPARRPDGGADRASPVPPSQRQESNLDRPLTRRLHDHRAASAYPRRDSNAHCPGPWPGASCQLGYEGEDPPRGFEPRFRRSERRVLPDRRRGRGAGDPRTCHAVKRRWWVAGRDQRLVTCAQAGVRGTTRSRMPASSGVRSPLRWLQPPQAATVLRQVFRPPRERGRMWSTVLAGSPQ